MSRVHAARTTRDARTPWLSCVIACALVAGSGIARADDDTGDAAGEEVEFDRPGLAFATNTLSPGAFAWEQGLPDVTTDRSAGIRTTEYFADTTLRFGLIDSLELQVEHDSLVHVTTRGGGLHDSATGSGNTTAGLLWTLPGGGEVFEWSMLGTATVAHGREPFGDDDAARDLGVTTSWNLTDRDSVSALANRSWSRDDRGWFGAVDYVRELRDDLQAYVEAGAGSGQDRQHVAGAGMMWRPRPHVQLDASFLRGLDRDSPDWQYGVGVSIYFAPRASAAR